MKHEEELQLNIQHLRKEVAAERYHEAITLYYDTLDTALYASGENRTIVELLESFLDEAGTPRSSIDQGIQERISRSLSAAYEITGHPGKAMALLEWFLSSTAFAHRVRSKAIVMRYLGRMMMSTGRLKSSEEVLLAGVALAQDAGEAGLETGLRRQLGILLAHEGRYDDARTQIASLPKGFGKHNHSDYSVYADRFLYSLHDQREASKAVYYANEMKKLADKYGYKNDQVLAESSLGLSYLLAGNLSRAEGHLTAGMFLCGITNHAEVESDLLLSRARYLSACNQDLHEVTDAAKNALSIATSAGYRLKQSDILCFLGSLALTFGDSAVAEMYVRNAYQAALCDGAPYWYMRTVREAEHLLERLNITPPMKYSSCFISYNHNDSAFARKLHSALQLRDVKCWLDEHEVLPGDYLLKTIDDGIKTYDKVLLCCSRDSLTSFWVDAEIEKAVHKEKSLWDAQKKRSLVMIPLDLDGFLHREWADPKASMLRARLSADFTDWAENEEKFRKQFEKLLLALRVSNA